MRILIAEDQPQLNRSLTKALTAAGWSVDAVSDGGEALLYLDGADYDAVVLDIMMPKVDGLTVLRTLRARGGAVPVLLLTARDTVSDRVAGLDAGADDYLIKPFALEELLARMPVERLLLPDIEDEYGVRDRLLELAREKDIAVTMVTDVYRLPMGSAMLTIYPPVGAGDLNEQGLTYLCSAGDFDALITGDMAGNTEKKLIEQFALPDIEVLVVGHHGSRYSSTDAFLQQVRPETAIISVGDNSYGHPTQEAMDRLSRNGAAVYRTDRQGNILVTANGGT